VSCARPAGTGRRTLSQALIALPYYRRTNLAMARNARHVIQSVLAEVSGAASGRG
jgi:hypothetical protein